MSDPNRADPAPADLSDLDVERLAAAMRLSFHEDKWSVQPYGDVVPWSWEQIAASVLARLVGGQDQEDAGFVFPDTPRYGW